MLASWAERYSASARSLGDGRHAVRERGAVVVRVAVEDAGAVLAAVREALAAGRVGERDGVAADVAVGVGLAGGLQRGLGAVDEEVQIGARPAAERGQVVASAQGDGAAQAVVFLAGEAVDRAGGVLGRTPGDARRAVGVGGVAGDDAAAVVEHQRRGAEAVGDVVAGVLVGGERRSAPERQLSDAADTASASPAAASGRRSGEASTRRASARSRRASHRSPDARRGVPAAGRRAATRRAARGSRPRERDGALGDALAREEHPADELAAADLEVFGEVEDSPASWPSASYSRRMARSPV
jgi:hypothetical protein